MDIFINQESKLKEYKSQPLLFTAIENSTATCEGYLSNVEHNEEELTERLDPTPEIVRIDSNYGHKKYVDYHEPVKVRKSNRGRKKKPKVLKARKYQGDGSNFNSQVSLSVVGEVVRKKSIYPDKYTNVAEQLEVYDNINDCVNKYEKFTKEYRVKVFRNGRYTVPGVLLENLSDIKEPLNKICNYLGDYLCEDVKLILLFSVTRNYKFRLLRGKIDIKLLHLYAVKHFQSLLNTRFSDIEKFLSKPVFLEHHLSPNEIGWSEFYHDLQDNSTINNNLLISFTSLKSNLLESTSSKNLFIDFNKLIDKINELPLEIIYKKVGMFVLSVHSQCFIRLHNDIIQNIIRYVIRDDLKKLERSLIKSKDNLLSHIKYDQENYPGFLIKVKTPIFNANDKRTTIKVFPSGKVNIDGSNNQKEATFIYYWLNDLFCQHPEFIYEPRQNYNDSDSEFSSDSD